MMTAAVEEEHQGAFSRTRSARSARAGGRATPCREVHFYFANVTAWTPVGLTYLQGNLEKVDVFMAVETHLRAEKLNDALAKLSKAGWRTEARPSQLTELE
eukprot:1525647-Pyramimonas_sp.AAC.1